MRWTLVLPNLASFRSRGKLSERWALATELGCEIVELPADLVKGPKEEERTGQAIGEVLDRSSIMELYGPPFPKGRFILHTDPGIPRRRRDGTMVLPKLRWSDPGWRRSYAVSVAMIVAAVGGRVEAVEVHPGTEEGDVEDLARGIAEFGGSLAAVIGSHIPIWVENKHRYRMDRIEDMEAVMNALPKQGYGLVVDVSNLWKTYRSRTERAMEELPWERVRGIHLHFRYRAPRADDPIDWNSLFECLKKSGGEVMVNPEVFHLSELRKAVDVISSGLAGHDRLSGPNALCLPLRR